MQEDKTITLSTKLLVLIMLVTLGFSSWHLYRYYTKNVNLKSKVEIYQAKLNYTKEEIQYKEQELAELKTKLEELSHLERMQKDISRIFDGRKD